MSATMVQTAIAGARFSERMPARIVEKAIVIVTSP